jgi:hypothetical protein
VLVGFIFPGGDDSLLPDRAFKSRAESGADLSYLEKVVIGLLGQGRGWEDIIVQSGHKESLNKAPF